MASFYRTAMVCVIVTGGWIWGDTFRHKTTGTVYTGYASANETGGRHLVTTVEKGPVQLNLAEYDVEWSDKGRNRFISVLPIHDAIENEIETAAFEKALIEETDKGPLYIVLDVDCPGGRVDLAKRICAAIGAIKYCKTVAFVKGGQYGGAYSAAAAISLACDMIYMVPETSLGAATMIAASASGDVMDMKEAYGETVGEKYNSAWRNYLASIAEENGRPGALAKAMADRDVVVLEVKRGDTLLYVEQGLPGDQVQRTVCKKGELLTLTANDAVCFGVANGQVANRQELLVALNCADAVYKESAKITEAKDELDKVIRRFNKLKENIDLKLMELSAKSDHGALTRSQAIRDFEVLIRNGENLLKLKRSYPDIPIDEEQILELVNIIKAEQSSVKAYR